MVIGRIELNGVAWETGTAEREWGLEGRAA
jgi:hypothetical protein